MKRQKKKHVVIGAGAVAVLAAVTLIAEGISYFSAETVDTKEGLAIIKAAEKENVKDTNNAHERELAKAHNLSTIADTIYNIIEELLQQFRKTSSIDSVTICMEGISYGSIHSAAVMDLAGLNYLIRDRLHHHTVVGTLLVTPPAEVKRFYTGSGNANKSLMISTFKGSFPDFDLPKIDDICDSEAMAKYARDWFEKNQ